MVSNWKAEFLQTIAQCFLGGIVLGLLTVACFHFGFSLTITAFIYLMAILLLSVKADFLALTILSFAAAACLVYYFAHPVFNFQIELPEDVAVTGSFLLIAFAVSGLVAGSRSQAKVALQYAAALRRSEAYLEEGQRLTHTGSWAWNVATRENVYWSPENFRIFGLDPSKDTQSFAAAIQRILPEDLLRFTQVIDAAIREKKDFEVGWRILLPDGNIRYVTSIGHPVIDKKGKVHEFVGTLVDVTEQHLAGEALERENAERKRAEDELRLSEAYLHEAQRLGRMGSWVVDMPTGAITATPEWFRIFDVDPERVSPTMEIFRERVHPDDRALTEDFIERRRQADADVAYRIILSDGTIRHLHSVSHPVFGDDGTAVKIFGTTMDVTERTLAEMKLKQSEAFLAEAQRVSHAGSFAYKRQNGEIVWSEETYKIFEFEPGVTPTMELVQQRAHPDDRAFLQMRFEESIRKGSPGRDDEYRLLMPDGRVKHIRTVRGTARPELADTFTVVGTVMDITKRKLAEEALRKAQADLAHAARVATLGELTATIAHEVNQPLAGVVSSGNACLRWLAGEPPNIENAKQSAHRIVRDAHRASEVIGRVRSLAKHSPPEKDWLNINEAVLETISLTRMEAAQHRASLRTQLSDEIQPVWADRIEVQQVILNLIMNAIEAVSGPENEQRDVSVATAKSGSNGIALTVQDTGAGLDPAKLERIFDAFYTTKREGMGMGLAVSRSIIEAHGGRLWATPNQPCGAVFQFTLPSAQDEAS